MHSIRRSTHASLLKYCKLDRNAESVLANPASVVGIPPFQNAIPESNSFEIPILLFNFQKLGLNKR
jgi:hypothetical protein